MLFTTQQLQGGPKYSHKTRIGNWQEEMELDEIKNIDFDGKVNNSGLKFHQTQAHFQNQMKKVPWSFSADGQLHWGDKIMMANKKTNGILVFNIGQRTESLEEQYAVTTTTQDIGPCGRAIFTLERVEDMDIFGGRQDPVIKFGQKVRLVSTPYVFKKPLYLGHTPFGPNTHALKTRRGDLSMHADKTYATVWTLEATDPNYRFELQGQPIRPNEPLLLKNAATNHFAGSDGTQISNTFGKEHEAFVHCTATSNKSQNLELEQKGKITGDLPSKFQKDENVFMVLCAPDKSFDQAIEELDKFTIDDLIKEIKAKIVQRSANGIRGIARIFKMMDDKGDRKLDVDDFRWGLIDFGIQISKSESQQILSHFDRNGDGYVNFDEFLVAIRGPLNQNRLQWIQRAYNKLDVNGDGLVKLDDIAQIYDVSQHPDVIQGKKTPEEALKEFMTLWDTQEKDGIVTLSEFQQYYQDVSASIDSDEYFAQMMQAAWKF